MSLPVLSLFLVTLLLCLPPVLPLRKDAATTKVKATATAGVLITAKVAKKSTTTAKAQASKATSATTLAKAKENRSRSHSASQLATTKARAQSHHAMDMELGAMLHQLSGKLLRLGDNRHRRSYMKDPLADGGELRMMEGLEKMANQVEKGMPISRVMTENARDSTSADRATATAAAAAAAVVKRGGGVAGGMRFKGGRRGKGRRGNAGVLCRDRVGACVV